MMLKKGVLVMLLATSCACAYGKSGPTYYTPERIAAAKENIAQYDWARKVRKRIFKTGDPINYYTGSGTYVSADKLAAQSDEFIWLLQPTTKIARVVPHERRATCPVCGDKAKEVSVWNPFRIDPFAHPYKVQCKRCKNWFPSNDYHKGDMTSGDLPDAGDGAVYTGEGEGKGKQFYLLREYAHMCYGTVTVPGLKALSQAWLISGESKYAYKGCILLARLATEYPNYGWKGTGLKLENRFDRTYLGPWKNRHPHYSWKHGGMITDLIWETWNLEDTAYAYDALYDYMDKDPKLIAFLKQKGMPIENGADLRRYIENYIFRAGMLGLQQGEIKGNEGFHQAAALAVALVMDDYGDAHPNSKDMVDYAFHGDGHSAYILTNGLTRDGGGHESPGYNKIKLDFIRVARLMEEVRQRRPGEFPIERYPDIFAGDKARAIFDYYLDLYCGDRFLPSIGDGGGIGKPYRYKKPDFSYLKHEYIYAVQRYGDPRHARACTDLEGNLFTGELWEPYPEKKIRELLKQPESRIDRQSRLLDGYGIAILESGLWPRKRAVSLNYTTLLGHRQCDNLSLGFWARGLDLLPDMGYPKTWDYRATFDSNSLTHNMVTVDETQPSTGSNGKGMARLFASVNGIHVATAHHDPYKGIALGNKKAKKVDLYERTVILVDIGPDNFYVVDLFAVNGGEQHDQSWHAMLVTPEAPELDWQKQKGGTLAGLEVKQFSQWTDRWGRKRKDAPSFITNIRSAPLAKPAAWTWKSGLPEGDSLRLHVIPLGGPATAIMGRGTTPVRKQNIKFLFLRRHVKKGAPSHFLTVLDAFQKTPVVQAIRVVSEKPLVLEVDRQDGIDEITIRLPEGPSCTTAHRPVGVRVRSRKDRTSKTWTRDVCVGSCVRDKEGGYVTTRIAAVDYAQKEIVIPWKTGFSKAFAAGSTIRIFNAERSALYRVQKAQKQKTQIHLTLDQTALLARGTVTSRARGQLTVDAHLTFAGFLQGAWAGEEAAARQIRSATQSGSITLKNRAHASALRKDYKDEIISIWQYAPGDQVEAALVSSK